MRILSAVTCGACAAVLFGLSFAFSNPQITWGLVQGSAFGALMCVIFLAMPAPQKEAQA